MDDRIRDWAAERGYRVAFGDSGMIAEVLAELEKRKAAGEFEEEFYYNGLAGLSPADPDLTGTTVIMLAVPRPAHRIVFHIETGPFEAVLPPTYLQYRRTSQRLGEELAALLDLASPLKPLGVPLKPLAARMGLVKYGRNNISYVPGVGSYHQLVGLATNLAGQPVSRIEQDLAMVECRTCPACRRACPTGAIGDDRFLLHAERCLTYLNEGPGAWPAWLPDEAHHCLVGCLRCQESCPQNRGLLRYERVEASFDREETARILAAGADDADPAWKRIEEKLTSIGLPGYGGILGRNLRVLLGPE